MNTLKRSAAVLLVLGFMLVLFAGCQSKEEDPILAIAGYSKDSVVMTFDGESVTAEDYMFWFVSGMERVRETQQMMGATAVNWDEEVMDGVTAKDFVMSEATESAKMLWVVERMATEYGVKLSGEEKAKIKQIKKDTMEQLGGEEIYFKQIHAMCMTDAMLGRMNEVGLLAEKIQAAMAEEDEAMTPSVEQLRTYMEDVGILKAKHILFLTMDPSGVEGEYSSAKKREQKKLAEDVLAELRASDDPFLLFDELMHSHSEDSGLERNPDGYLFSMYPDGIDFTGRMVPEFEEGTQALAYKEISEVVKSEYGYHIILRLDPTEDAETVAKYEQKWRSQQMEKIFQERMDALEVVTTEVLDELDIVAFDESLQQKQVELSQEIADIQEAQRQEQAPEEDQTEEDQTEASQTDGDLAEDDTAEGDETEDNETE